jgi:hypothetical protein
MRRWRGHGRRPARSGIEDAADQKGEDKVAAAIVTRAKDAVEADMARRAERRGDMAV